MKILIAIALALAAIALAVLTYRAEPDTLDQRVKAEQSREQDGAHPAPSVVLSINASKPSAMVRAANAAVASPLSQEFYKTRSLKALYDRLSAPGGATTGEEKFTLFRIVSRCGRRADVNNPEPKRDRATRRLELEAMIPMANPDRDKRLALFDQMSARCEGLESLATTSADLDKLLADAASTGDAKAQARLAFPPMTNGPNGAQMKLSDDQFRTLQSAIASRDPEAIMIAGTALSNTYDDAVLRLGPDQAELSPRASLEAWRLMACEYGMDCGPDNLWLQQGCVEVGHCAASTVQDQVFYYGVSPYESQLIDQYRQIFRNAVANNDWSALQLSRQLNTGGSRFYAMPSP